LNDGSTGIRAWPQVNKNAAPSHVLEPASVKFTGIAESASNGSLAVAVGVFTGTFDGDSVNNYSLPNNTSPVTALGGADLIVMVLNFDSTEQFIERVIVGGTPLPFY